MIPVSIAVASSELIGSLSRDWYSNISAINSHVELAYGSMYTKIGFSGNSSPRRWWSIITTRFESRSYSSWLIEIDGFEWSAKTSKLLGVIFSNASAGEIILSLISGYFPSSSTSRWTSEWMLSWFKMIQHFLPFIAAIRRIPRQAPIASISGRLWPITKTWSDCFNNSLKAWEITRARTRVRLAIGFVFPP